MDRLDEFHRITRIFNADVNTNHSDITNTVIKSSAFIQTALRLSDAVDGNELILKRMESLSTKKEFSNDPSQEIVELSDLFQKKMAHIKLEMEQLKRLSQDTTRKMVMLMNELAIVCSKYIHWLCL